MWKERGFLVLEEKNKTLKKVIKRRERNDKILKKVITCKTLDYYYVTVI